MPSGVLAQQSSLLPLRWPSSPVVICEIVLRHTDGEKRRTRRVGDQSGPISFHWRWGGSQCQVLIGSGFALIDCAVDSCVVDLLWENGGELTAHEKAVPAMIGGHDTKPHHGRNGKWPTQGSGLASDGGRNR